MNRKLHNTFIALSTTGLLLVVGLMAATPAGVANPKPAMQIVDAADNVDRRTDAIERRAEAQNAAIEARARAFEAEFVQATDSGQAIAVTASFVAEVAAESALSAIFAEAEAASAADREAAKKTERSLQRKRRNARSALALPYFSFAHGLRRGNGS